MDAFGSVLYLFAVIVTVSFASYGFFSVEPTPPLLPLPPEDYISYEIRDEFKRQDMPRDGGTAKGYITFLMTTEQTQAKDGVWAIEALSNYNEATYIKVRTQ